MATNTSNEGAILIQNDVEIGLSDTHLNRSITNNLFEVQDQSLIESLSRLVLVGSQNWIAIDPLCPTTLTEQQMAADFAQPSLYSLKFPETLLKSEFIKNKLKNVAYMSADVEVILRVQGTPFLQGELWMFQEPYGKGTTPDRRTLNEHLRSLTSFHGVRLNLQSLSRTAKLVMPYVNEFQVINPNDGDGLSTCRIIVTAPLTGESDSVKASTSVFARMVNVKLYGHGPTEGTSTHIPLPASIIVRTQDSGEDESASKQGIISSVAGTVASISDVVSDIPIIGEIAKPISWAARAVKGIASMFGFSRPMDLMKNQTISNVPAKGFTNSVGIDASVNLSVLPDNAIECTKTTFDSEDEMAISYLASREFLLDRYAWDVNALHKDIICTIPVHPANMFSYGAVRNQHSCIFGPPISLVSQLGKYWRGQLSINLRFAKTIYHQGRLLVQYLPYGSGVQPIESVLSEIIDLSQVDDGGFMIAFPSIVQNKWLKSLSLSEGGYDPQATAGIIQISVMNELIAPSTVAREVILMPWLHWTDFEIAEPGSLLKIAYSETAPPPEEPSFNLREVTVPIRFTLDRQTRICSPGVTLSSAGDSLQIGVVGDDYTARDFIPFTTATESGGTECYIQDRPPGEYELSFSLGGSQTVTMLSDYPIAGALAGPKLYEFSITDGASIILDPDATLAVVDTGLASIATTFVTMRDDPFTKRIMLGDAGESEVLTSRTAEYAQEWEASVVPGIEVKCWCTSPLGGEPVVLCQDSGFVSGDASNQTTTMGEVVPSLRLLSRRFTVFGQVTEESEVILPGLAYERRDQTWTRKSQQTLVDIISWLYRFTAGGVRYKMCNFTTPAATPNTGLVYTTTTSLDKIDTNSDFLLTDSNSALHLQNTLLNPIVEINTPFYCPAENLAIGSTTFTTTSASLSQVQFGTVDGSQTSFLVLKAAADDQTFSCLVGCPAFYVGPKLG